jgi:voltage-gated potassium channel
MGSKATQPIPAAGRRLSRAAFLPISPNCGAAGMRRRLRTTVTAGRAMKAKISAAIADSSLWRTYLESRYSLLFYLLLLMLVATPTAAMLGIPQGVMKAFAGVVLLAAVMPNATKRTGQILFVSVVLIVVLRMLSEEGELPVAPGLVLALGGVVGLLAAAGALRFAVSAPRVDAETIYAALSTYLLVGLFFGEIYWAIEQSWPDSLSGPDKITEFACTYYSFVTLASLGYGDVLPRSDIARGVAVLEVVGGQLFLAVLVARLVGGFTSPKIED